MCPMEQYIPVAHTRPKPPHVGYCSRKQDAKELFWGQQFCQMERNISVRPTDRNDQTGQGTTFKAGPKYSGLTELKWSVPFDF